MQFQSLRTNTDSIAWRICVRTIIIDSVHYFKCVFEIAEGNCLCGLFSLVLQKREERLKNRARQFQAHAPIAIRAIPFSTFEI